MLKRFAKPLAILCSFAFALSVFACGNSAKPAENTAETKTADNDAQANDSNNAEPAENTDAKPKGSGQLSVYTAFPEEQAQAFFQLFEKETGIKIKSVRLSAGEIYTRVQAEANNPQASVWFGTSSETFMVAGEGGFLEEYRPESLADIPEKYQDSKGLWTPFVAQSICFLTNENWLKENNIEAPTSWQDLLEPVYADNIAIAHPATSGMSYTWLAYMCQLMGEDEAFSYLEKLNDNIFQYAKSSNAPPRMVGMQECGLTVAYTNQGLTNRQEGYPIAISYPDEGTSFEISAMGLIKNGPADEAENARLFMDWALTPEAQAAYAEMSFMIPMNPNTIMPEGVVLLDELKTVDLDGAWASENRERLLNRFETEIRGQENLA